MCVSLTRPCIPESLSVSHLPLSLPVSLCLSLTRPCLFLCVYVSLSLLHSLVLGQVYGLQEKVAVLSSRCDSLSAEVGGCKAAASDAEARVAATAARLHEANATLEKECGA